MRTSFRSLLGRRPEVEALEDRALPSISLPTPGHPGPVTITGTSGPDQFVIRLQAGNQAKIQFSDDGGMSFQTAALSDVTQVVVNGAGGTDLLTLDMGNGLVGNTATGGLPIQFTSGPGHHILDVVGNPGGTITETFTLGSSSSPSTLSISNGTMTAMVSVTASTSIVDSLTATNFVFNGTAGNDLIHLQSQTRQGATALVISGVNAQTVPGSSGDDSGADRDQADGQNGHGDDHQGDNSGENGQGDDNEGDNAGVLEFEDDQDETTANAFAALALTNKTNVTVNGLGGDDLFVANVRAVPTGLKTLTLDGGAGTNVLVGRALPAGLTTNLVNIQRQDTDDNDILIDMLFAERLDRTVDMAGLNFFRGVLNSAGRQGVINDIEESLEARTDLVRSFFQHFLGRDLDAAGGQFFVTMLAQGASEEEVQANILGSQEFMQRAQSMVGSANANEDFVRAASRLLLNRDADANGLAFFENAMQTNGRAAAALSMMQSQEFRTMAITSFFQSLLGRNLDDAGRTFWTSQTQDLQQIREGIEGSDEFSSRS
jgi:hypothetical protein